MTDKRGEKVLWERRDTCPCSSYEGLILSLPVIELQDPVPSLGFNLRVVSGVSGVGPTVRGVLQSVLSCRWRGLDLGLNRNPEFLSSLITRFTSVSFVVNLFK